MSEQPGKMIPACVSVVMPVFNERATVEKVIGAIFLQPLVGELVVVDDCSSDGTFELLKDLAGKDPRIVLDRHKINRGKGAAIRSGFQKTTKEIIVIQDADLEYDPSEYPVLISPILQGQADVVFGSRFIGSQAHRVLYFWHSVGNRFLTLLSNMLTNLNLTDMETGHKAFRRIILEQIDIEEDRFGFEPEITAKVARLEARIYEVAVSYHGRTYEEGKKIGWKDGVHAIWCILKYAFWKGNRCRGDSAGRKG